MSIRDIGASITMNASEFKKEMKAVNANLSGLQAEMKAVTAEFAENADSAEALARRQQILNDQEAAAKAKVDLLTKAYQEQVDKTGEASDAAGRLRKQLNNATADYAKATQAADDNRKSLAEARSVTERLANAKEQLKKKLEDLAPHFRDLATVAHAAGSALGATAKGTAALVTAGAAASVALGTLAVAGFGKLVELTKEAATAVDSDGNLINTQFSTLAANLTRLDAGATAAKTALGTLLLPALESLSGTGAKLLEDFSRDLQAAEGDTERMGKVCSVYIRMAAKAVKTELPGLIETGTEILGALMDGVSEATPELLSAAGDIIQMLMDGLVEHAGDMGDGAADLVSQLLQFIISNAPQLLTAGITLISSLINGISSDLPALIPVAVQAIQELLGALVSNAPQLLIAGLTLIMTLVEGIVDHIGDIFKVGKQLFEEFIDGFEGNMDGLTTVGSRIVEKILDGLRAAWHKLTDWIGNALSNLDSLGPEIGYSSGFAGGLNYVPYDNFPALLHQGERVLTAAENASGAYGGGGSNTVNITVNTRELSRAQTDYIIRRADAELGKGV